MNTGPKALRVDRALGLNAWLRRRLRGEAWQQFLEGAVFLALGIGLMAVVFGPILLIELRASDKFTLAVAARTFLFLVLLIFMASLISWSRPNYSDDRADRPLYLILAEFFLGGPAQCGLGINCLEKSWRLMQCDVPRVAEILLWLFDRRHKFPIEELSAKLSGPDAVRLLPQLRNISGVIWLTHRHGVVMLSPELRREIAIALNRIPEAQREEDPPWTEPPPKSEPNFDEAPADSESAEKIAWYLALGLPPFAPLSAVKKRYRQLAKIYHPDASAGLRPRTKMPSDEEIKKINAAYENILKNSKRARI